MASKRHTPEEIVAKLRQVDVLTSQGSTVADAVRQIGVTEVILIESWRPPGTLFLRRLAAKEACGWPTSGLI